MTLRSVVKGTGSALPERRVDNAELAERVDTSDEWIVERTGIRSRYLAAEGETTATLAVEACRRALEAAGLEPEDIGVIWDMDGTLVASATVVPDAFIETVTRLGATPPDRAGRWAATSWRSC